jgi:2,3-bisphosphoglycerate-independent phosphoglycerate mutase
MTAPKPVVLCILDGWGLSPRTEDNAPVLADTPNFDRLMATCAHATLTTHGPDVGLPTGQMGNSEVGHTNIGAGRVVAMDLGEIDLAIEDGSFFRNPAILGFVEKLKASGGTAHLMGLASMGGVHAQLTHMIAAAKLIAGKGVPVAIHAITDGRDVPPTSAGGTLAELEAMLPAGARIATVVGRYFAMDRDNRWDRVEKAYRAMVGGEGRAAPTAAAAVEAAYARGETDEFIDPTVVGGFSGARDGDGVFFLNFRADRAREILRAVGEPGFDRFEAGAGTGARPRWAALLGMVDYSKEHDAYIAAAYPKKAIVNTIGEWVSSHGLTQFRLAETEKYPHVTFFLNGGREAPFAGEDRLMPPSPKVATYDLKPEMSAPEVTDRLVAAIGSGKYDAIVCNYANGDMVGHTGILDAAVKAVETLDASIGRVVDATRRAGGEVLITADHGNAEMMHDPATGQPHTAHTLNVVPLVYVGRPAQLATGGELKDIAPTLLAMMGLPQPTEMTGRSLLAPAG